MKHRIVLASALLTALVSFIGISATAAQAATTHYTIHNITLGCIADPGPGQQVWVRFTCTTTFTLTDPVTYGGNTYYLLRINGGSDCLKLENSYFVFDEGCNSSDASEYWSPDIAAYILYNLADDHALSTCNDTGNSRLITLVYPVGCNITSSDQYTWILES